MRTPKIVLTADRTLMSPYRGLSLATFFGCAPAIDPNRDKNSFWYKILGKQVTPKILFDFICNYIPHENGVAKYEYIPRCDRSRRRRKRAHAQEQGIWRLDRE